MAEASIIEAQNQVLAACLDTARATGQNFYLGKFPQSVPAVAAYLARNREAQHFARVIGARPIGPIGSKQEFGTEVGRTADEAISAAPNIMADRKDRLWDGTRRLLETPKPEMLEVMRGVYDFEARYHAHIAWTRGSIDELEAKLAAAIKDPSHHGAPEPDPSWPVALGFVGCMVGLAVGVGVFCPPAGVVLEGAEAKVFWLKVCGVIATGGAAGAGAGAQLTPYAGWMAERLKEVDQLKTLREKLSHLEEEGVSQGAVGRIRDCVEKYDHEMQILNHTPQDRERRRIIEERTRRELSDIMQGHKRAPGWEPLSASLLQAISSRNPARFADAMIALCGFGNGLRQTSIGGMQGRINKLLDGYAAGKIPSPINDPDALWR